MPIFELVHQGPVGRPETRWRVPSRARRPGLEQSPFVVATDHRRAKLAGQIQDAGRVGAASHQVPHEAKAVAGRKRHSVQELVELGTAAVDVPDENDSAHGRGG